MTTKINLTTLMETPPWEWPEDAGQTLLEILHDEQTSESDLDLAAGLAGDYTVVNDALADALLSVASNGSTSQKVRGRAAISLGPVLEQVDTEGFEDGGELPITEETFHKIQNSLHELYTDPDVPDEVRRPVLEASVRAPQDWHQDAIRAALVSDQEAWRLTAVFCMRFVRGFDDQILEALDSDNADVHYQAVMAAGNWDVAAAWQHVVDLVSAEETDKPLLLAAIEAVGSIRPREASEILDELRDSDDEDIVDAVNEALILAEGLSDEDDEDDDDWDDEDDEEEDEDEEHS